MKIATRREAHNFMRALQAESSECAYGISMDAPAPSECEDQNVP